MVSARQNEITSVRKQFSIYWGATRVMPSVLANFPFRFLWAFVMLVFRSIRILLLGFRSLVVLVLMGLRSASTRCIQLPYRR